MTRDEFWQWVSGQNPQLAAGQAVLVAPASLQELVRLAFEAGAAHQQEIDNLAERLATLARRGRPSPFAPPGEN